MNRTIIAALGLTCAHVSQAQSETNWTFAGYVEIYYMHDAGRPASGDNVNARGFDTAQDTGRLTSAQLDISKVANARDPWGLTLQLYGGKNSELIHLTEPGGKDSGRYIRQAYVTFVDPQSRFSADFGKFDTWMGYEGIDTRSQDQYSRSFIWTYAEPVYEAGLRVTGRLGPKLSGALYVVRGWNEVMDGNGSPSLGLALSYAPDDKSTVTLQNHLGQEGSDDVNGAGSYGGIGFANPGTSSVHLVNMIVTRQLTSATKAAISIEYARSSSSPNNGTWNGVAGYLRHQIDDVSAVSFRAERFEDRDGLRFGSPIQLFSLTGGYDRTLCKNATLRLEARHDFASKDAFNSSGGSLSNERTTMTLALVIRF